MQEVWIVQVDQSSHYTGEDWEIDEVFLSKESAEERQAELIEEGCLPCWVKISRYDVFK